LVFELASKVGDAIPYCAKAISICQSCIQDLKNAKEALLADKDVSASAGEEHSRKLTPEYKISLLSRILARFQKKVNKLDFVDVNYSFFSGI
jgi:nuclear autoantigenic sperm protein